MPSARTSVGNEEDEYERKKKRAAQLQQAVTRRWTDHFGAAAGAAALRHDPTIGQLARRRQQFHVKFVRRVCSDVQKSRR